MRAALLLTMRSKDEPRADCSPADKSGQARCMPIEWVCTTAIPAYQSTTKPDSPSPSPCTKRQQSVAASVPGPNPTDCRTARHSAIWSLHQWASGWSIQCPGSNDPHRNRTCAPVAPTQCLTFGRHDADPIARRAVQRRLLQGVVWHQRTPRDVRAAGFFPCRGEGGRKGKRWTSPTWGQGSAAVLASVMLWDFEYHSIFPRHLSLGTPLFEGIPHFRPVLRRNKALEFCK